MPKYEYAKALVIAGLMDALVFNKKAGKSVPAALQQPAASTNTVVYDSTHPAPRAYSAAMKSGAATGKVGCSIPLFGNRLQGEIPVELGDLAACRSGEAGI